MKSSYLAGPVLRDGMIFFFYLYVMHFTAIVTENSAPGSEIKPSGYKEYLEKSNEQTWSTLEDAIAPAVSKQYTNNIYQPELNQQIPSDYTANVSYDFPYEPEKFDLSEADFGASPTFGDSGYNGSLNYTASSTHSSASDRPSENGVQGHNDTVNEPGTPYENVKPGFPNYHSIVPNNFELDLGKPESSKENSVDKLPVEADLSPTVALTKYSYKQNGYSEETNKLQNGLQNEQPVLQTQLSSIPSISSLTSSSSDPDKYPVQCNTPQTPKENPLLNPLESQLSISSGASNDTATTERQVKGLPKSSPIDSDCVCEAIPKLENLKNDLEKNIPISHVIQHSSVGHIPSNSSQSLPASFHTNIVKNDVSSGGSLPMELDRNSKISESTESSASQFPPTTDLPSQGINLVSHTADTVSDDMQINEKAAFDAVNNWQNTGVPDFNSVQVNQTGENSMETNPSVHNVDTKGNDQMADYLKGDEVLSERKSVLEPKQQKIPCETVVGFGDLDGDVHVSESDLNAYLADSSTHSALLNSEQVENMEKRMLVEAGSGHQQNLAPMVIPDNKSSDINEHKQNIDALSGDQMCNMQNPTESVSFLTNTSAVPSLNLHLEPEPVVKLTEDSDLEVLKVLSQTSVHNPGVNPVQPVITKPMKALSPDATVSIDSGCASMQDCNSESSASVPRLNESGVVSNGGARPKDVNSMVQGNNSLTGLSAVDPITGQLDNANAMVVTSGEQIPVIAGGNVELVMDEHNVKEICESRQLMETGISEPVLMNGESSKSTVTDQMADNQREQECEGTSLEGKDVDMAHSDETSGRPNSWSPGDGSQPSLHRQKRPNSLNLPPPPTIDPTDRDNMEEDHSPERTSVSVMETGVSGSQDSQPVGAGWYQFCPVILKRWLFSAGSLN